MFCSRVQILHLKCFFPPLPPYPPLSPPVRGILGLLVCFSFVAFRRAVQQKLGTAISTFLILITVSQFHFLFYASRPLPNTFALILGEQQSSCFCLSLFCCSVLMSLLCLKKKGEITQTCFRLFCQEFDLLSPFPALLAFRYWLMQQHGLFIWVSGAAVIIFRSELSILLGIILLLEIGGRRLGVWRAVGHIVSAGVVWLSR